MKREFSSWTDYDEWLKDNCEIYTITVVEERSGKICIEYLVKE